MAVITRRQYVTEDQIEQFSDITITDDAEASDQANWAEEMIDAYVGYQEKHIPHTFNGIATGGTTTTLVDTSGDTALQGYDEDYFIYCEIEMLSGSNKGEKRTISAYNPTTKTATVNTAFSNAVASGDAYAISQLGKFPRVKDAHSIDDKFYKTIPEAVTRATLAQLEYIIEKGSDFFASGSEFKREQIGDYEYERGSSSGITGGEIISTHAKVLLRGITNRKGSIKV